MMSSCLMQLRINNCGASYSDAYSPVSFCHRTQHVIVKLFGIEVIARIQTKLRLPIRPSK